MFGDSSCNSSLGEVSFFPVFLLPKILSGILTVHVATVAFVLPVVFLRLASDKCRGTLL